MRFWTGLLLGLALLAASTPPTHAQEGFTLLRVAGRPFMALPSKDGEAIFVSVGGAARNSIQVFARNGSAFTPGVAVPMTAGVPQGMALSPDGSTVLVADQSGVAAFSAYAALAGQIPPVGYLREPRRPGSIEVTFSTDGRYAFVTNEMDHTIGVIRMESRATAQASPGMTLVGEIGTDPLPVGIAASPDGRWIYATSEISADGRRTCVDQNGARRTPGTLLTIDAKLARTDPEHSAVAAIAVGCAPVRVALTPDGGSAWVTVRGENHLAAYDAAALRTNPAAARRATVDVGMSPVGLALLDRGRLAVVASSDRFTQADRTQARLDVVDTIPAIKYGNVATRTLATGAYPREITESPQHDVIYLTNYQSGTVQVIPESMLH